MMESSRTQGTSSPCAACKLLRRRCVQHCVFAPYFPADDPQKFVNVHKVFGASNVNKMLQELPVHQRGDAVSSMVYEANARVRDPVYGCVGTISSLQHQIDVLQTQFSLVQAEVVHMHMRQVGTSVSGLAGNWIGSSLSDEHVAYRFKMLRREVAISTDSSYLSDMFWAVSWYCGTKWDECKESLKRYWWSIFLFAATIILLVLTFRQTIFTVHRYFHLPL